MSRINKNFSSSAVQDIHPSIQEHDLAKPTKPLTGPFPGMYAYFPKQNARVYRTDGRDGPVSYFAIKNHKVRHIMSSELGVLAWAWGENHD